MAKKNKTSLWWKKWDEAKQDDLYSNTRRQHAERLKGGNGGSPSTGYLEEDDYDRYDYKYDYSYSGYDYGFNKQFKGDKEDNFGDDWSSYQKTGQWKGYSSYKSATLSYKYVQQMANTIALQGDVKIEIGNTWEVDVEKRTLVYNPTSLMYGTKGELIATLLHEVGKISKSSPRKILKSVFLSLYGDPAYNALQAYEDMRVDMLMIKEYPSAGEVYESNVKVVEKVAQEHLKRGRYMRQVMNEMADDILRRAAHLLEQNRMASNGRIDQEEILKDYMALTSTQNFGKRMLTIEEVEEHVRQFKEEQEKEPMLDEYMADIMRVSYGIDSMNPVENCEMYTNATAAKISDAVKMESTQEVITMMDHNVYPVIEPILKQFKQGTQAAQKFFPNNAKTMMDGAVSMANKAGMVNPSETDSKGNSKVRLPGNGRSDEGLPKEWHTGDYKALKESVDYEIRNLIARLTYIKREEDVIRYVSNQRRGKLDTKKLYRVATGNRRIFKKRLPKRDTVQSFAFSMMVDISGSMEGDRVVHANRGCIILSEVFSKFGIPFEIIVFDGYAKTLKSFDDAYDSKMKTKVGGITKMPNGGTTLTSALEQTKILEQTESNKVVIVLTDGDTEDHKTLDQKYFIPWEKKGVKSMGIGIEVGDNIKTLCHGNGIAVENANKLPELFSDMLKRFIKR